MHMSIAIKKRKCVCEVKSIDKTFQHFKALEIDETFYSSLNLYGFLFKEMDYSFKGNWVFAKHLNSLIPISLQPNNINLWYFKLSLFHIAELKFEISKVYDIGL